MFKTITVFFLLLAHGFALNAAESRASSLWPLWYSSQLKETVALIQQLPEAKALIKRVRQQGPLSIYCSSQNHVSRQFGACWDPARRIIFVDQRSHSSKGALIGSILFELQNALANSAFHYYDDLAAKGKIEQARYVRSVEYLEYRNSLNAAKLAEQGIRLGLFPADARLPVYDSFEEYYYFQKLGGHSAQIAHNYLQLRT